LEDVLRAITDDHAMAESDLAADRLLCPRYRVEVLGRPGCARQPRFRAREWLR
jgi:hypothetical protein